MSDKSIKIALILSAVDKMTAVINKANANAKKAFDFGKISAVAGAAMAAPLIYATNKAVEFEDKMADVAKVFNAKIGDSTFVQLGEQAKDLSVYLSKSAEESAALMASLGQGGVLQNDLDKVSKSAGQIAVAFDLSADIAGDRYTKLKNALNSSWDETKKISDAINYLSDSQASKASEILEFMAAGGAGVAKSSKTAAQDLAAMGSYLISVGKSGAESSTILERFYKGIMSNKGSRDMFLKAGQGAEGFMTVLEKGSRIPDPGKKFEYFKQFGEYGSELMAMAGNMDQLKASLSSVADETSYLGSVEKEFINRNSTARGKMNKGWAEFNRIVLDFGTNGIPVLLELLETIRPIIQSVSSWMQNNKELTGTIFKVVAGAAALSFGVSALSFAFGGAFKIIAATTAAFKWLKLGQAAYLVATAAGATVTGGFTAALGAMNLMLLANPIGLTIAAVAALIALFVLAYNKVDWFRAGIQGVIAVSKLLASIYIGLGKAIIGALSGNWGLFAEGAMQSAKAVKSIMNGGIQESFNTAYTASIATSRAQTGSEQAAAAGKAGIKIAGVSSRMVAPAPQPVSKLYNTPVTFAPVINLSGGATKQDGKNINASIKDQFGKMMKDYEAKQKRLAY